MLDKPVYVLCTRQLDEALIEKAADSNVIIDVISFIDTQPLNNKVLQTKLTAFESKKTVAVFTSPMAVSVLFEKIKDLKNWKFYVLSGATLKTLLHHFPKADVAGMADHALGLAQKMVQDKVKKAMFFCGDLHRPELTDHCQKHHVNITELVIYETVHKSIKMDKEYDGVLFFSPSAGESFFKENTPQLDTIFFTIGQTTANSLADKNYTVVTSTSPKPEILVDTVISYYRQLEPVEAN